MHKVRPELLFINILISIDKISRNLKNLSYVEFITDEKTFALVTREMQEIGESAKKLKRNPGPWSQSDIDWQDIVDFRNIVVHRYFGINPEIIFDIAITEVPELKENVLSFLKQSPDKEYILQSISGLKNIFKKLNRKETVIYLNKLAELVGK